MAMISAVYVLKKTRVWACTLTALYAFVPSLPVTQAQEYDFVLVGILLGFALLLLFTDCCSCTFVGRLRGLLVLISCLSAAVGAIALKVPSMSYTIVFLSGVAGIAVLALLILLVQCSSHRLSIDPQSTVTTALLEDSSPGFNNPLFKHSSTAPYHPMSSTTLQSNTGEQMHGQDAMRTL